MIVADGNHQQAERGIQPEGFWRERSEGEPTGPGPCDQQEDVAEKQRETLMAGGGPVADFHAHEPVIGARNRYGYDHQEVSARQTNNKGGEPWPPVFPEQELAAKDKAEDARQRLPYTLTSLERIAEDSFALIAMQR